MLAVTDEELTAALERAVAGMRTQRQRLFLAGIARANFNRLREFCSELPLLRVGYSVKTNPRAELLSEALNAGFYPECISPGEVQQSLQAGFTAESIVYNGPVPASQLGAHPRFVFADSIEAYVKDCAALTSSIVGVRLRAPHITSRFGVPPEQWADLASAIHAQGRDEICFSFQVRSEDCGPYDFFGLADTIAQAASTLVLSSSVRVVAFDVGGGRSAREFDVSAQRGDYQRVCDMAASRFAHLREVLLEPGQELDASVEAMLAPVLEIRNRAGARDIVIDAGRPDFPEIDKTPHRVYVVHNTQVRLLESGTDRILGRTCLEDDVVAQVRLPAEIRPGDAILIADSGAYDASMHYAFAQGSQSGNTSP